MKTNDLLITRPTKAVPCWGIHQMEKNGNVTVIAQNGGCNRKEAERRAWELTLPFRSAIFIQTKRGNRIPLVPAPIMELQAQLNEHVSNAKKLGVTINLGSVYSGRTYEGTVTSRIRSSINHIEIREKGEKVGLQGLK